MCSLPSLSFSLCNIWTSHPATHAWCLLYCLWGSAVIWGWCSWSGLVSATVWVQRMKSADYIYWMTRLFINGFFWHWHIIRWQCHQAHTVKEGFRKHETLFSHMDWTQQSTNLNPIKDLWDGLEIGLNHTSSAEFDSCNTTTQNKVSSVIKCESFELL